MTHHILHRPARQQAVAVGGDQPAVLKVMTWDISAEAPPAPRVSRYRDRAGTSQTGRMRDTRQVLGVVANVRERHVSPCRCICCSVPIPCRRDTPWARCPCGLASPCRTRRAPEGSVCGAPVPCGRSTRGAYQVYHRPSPRRSGTWTRPRGTCFWRSGSRGMRVR